MIGVLTWGLRALALGLWLAGFASMAMAQRHPVAVNLAEISDWSAQQPFINVMKTARRWIGHKPRQWGGMDFSELDALGILDEDGWPRRIPEGLSSIGTLVLTDLPEDAPVYAGRYRLRFNGDGIVELRGRAANIRYGRNEITFDFTPGPGSVDIRIKRSDREGTGDYLRNISVVRLDLAADYDAGQIFNPAWLAHVEGFAAFRFMDWMYTNNSLEARWQDRPRVGDYTYGRRGVPVEIMVALGNLTGADVWFNMPHLADETYNRGFAQVVYDTLGTDLTVYVEYSNEVWNWMFEQTHWAEAQSKARWGEEYRNTEFYGLRTAEMARIWDEVFAGEARDQLVTVISTHTDWLGLERDILEAPLWQAEGSPGIPADFVDAYAVSGYFGHVLSSEKRADLVRGWLGESLKEAEAAARAKGLGGTAFDAYVEAHRYDLATKNAAQELRNGAFSGDTSDTLAQRLGETWPYHQKVAARYGLELIVYEGGTHVTPSGAVMNDEALTDFFTHLNYSDAMGELYRELLQGWFDLGGGLFAAYSDVHKPSKWGSWGGLRHLGDSTARWDALLAYW